MVKDTTLQRRQFVKAAGAGSVLGTVGIAGCTDDISGGSGGGEFPSQDIEMICPWAEGGGTDQTARQLASGVENHLDTSAYVSNQTGGTGSVGFGAIANAAPDGHTVGVLTVEITTIEHLGVAQVSHEDVEPILQYNFDPAALTVPEDAPYGTLSEFIDYAEDNPGEISVSNSGPGGIWHLSAAGFAQEAGIELDHVGYNGAAPATEAVVNGEVQATTSSAPEVAGQVEDGPLTTLAVFGEERVDLMPDTPTLMEEGVDFSMGAWRGLGVPNDTPDDVISTLYDAYNSVYESDEFQEFMDTSGFGLRKRDTEEFGQFMQQSYEDFGELVENLELGE
ncbi:tripartite tricarboxylate transporter substrate binding protein [Natrinema sp. SYSU A 869]|uniref:Bug family tripartite tricarboxylate transporter substrate binding protein n=1 Tax=Natrinema sp. SYSU A 869 TaxID=2871694 RepID=UPI001CA43E74|nr:tripartite tricarboxylate transporter substrate binding protein [Natrinema sp. SYSU A 869]